MVIHSMFSRFPNLFYPFPLVLPHVSPSISMVSFGVSPVSWQCYPCFLFQILPINLTYFHQSYRYMHSTLFSFDFYVFSHFVVRYKLSTLFSFDFFMIFLILLFGWYLVGRKLSLIMGHLLYLLCVTEIPCNIQSKCSAAGFI